MKKTSAFLLSLAATTTAAIGATAQQPNIIFILTDDLGYGNLGSFFQNARRDAGNRAAPWHTTPQLDAMAAQGARLTHHYCSAPVSAPSRASLLSGLSQGHANVRDSQFDKALADNHTIGTVLRQAGYSTVAIGKWGLAGRSDTPDGRPAHPLNRGFDYYYGYMRHVDGHEHYPKEQLYFAEKAKVRGPVQLWENHTNVVSTLDKCYTTDLFTARAKKWIVDHTKASSGKPFFLYLAYDTPHAVLELPTQAYPKGGGLNGGVQWLGKPGRMINTASGQPDSWMHPDYASATYDDDNDPSTPEKPWPDVNKRFAASVRRIDDAVGDLFQTLRDLQIDENTIVVFTSDNGPSRESYLPGQEITPEFFASFAGFDGLKRDVLEGGLRVPAIVRWPGHVPEGGVIDAPCAMWDWLPTFASLAGIPAPANADGISLVARLTGNGTSQARDYLYFEHFTNGRVPDYASFEQSRRGRFRKQMQAVRLGDFMAVRYDIKSPEDDFEIYDVVRDPKEARNLAQSPEGAAMQARLKALAVQARRPEPDSPRPYDTILMPAIINPPAKTAPGLSWTYAEGSFPWVPAWAALRANQRGVSGAGLDFAPLRQGQGAAIVFQGWLRAPADGEYAFQLSTDTGAVLRLHEAAMIDADQNYGSGELRTATAHLKAGLHPFTLTYRTDGKKTPLLVLKWKCPGLELQAIPASAFVTFAGN